MTKKIQNPIINKKKKKNHHLLNLNENERRKKKVSIASVKTPTYILESDQKKVKKLKETKLKRTSSSKTRTLKGKHEKSLRLDEALSRTDMEGWSSARVNAYKAIETNPNMYYYRFNAPGEKQRNGGWTEEEKEMFQNRMKELGGTGDYQWGIFSMAIPGRVGYQCANFYR